MHQLKLREKALSSQDPPRDITRDYPAECRIISLLGVLSYILQDNLQYGILSCKVNPDVLANLIDLAEFYQSQGRYSEAESLHIQVLEQRKRLLGDDHPDVAIK
ncbi:MAG: tetratricopeptide repeat protein [Cyanothece sp. SIO1E1]|nr:tetratricopeptide repeat protein [Cyanothece sp. SIO1E1]